MRKPDDIIDRDAEWATLTEVWNEASAQLVFLDGRRRAGKSWLLQRFALVAGGLYHQATRGTRGEQIARLARAVGEHFGDAALRRGAALPDWEALLQLTTDSAGGRPFLLVLDEFPYLAEENADLASVLQALWDHRWKAEGTMKVVLAGSYVTLMKQLEERDQPLFGRRTRRISVRPFSHREIPSFLPRYDRRDQMRAYGIFGGLAGHLDQLDPAASLGENVARQLLDPSRMLHDEATQVLDGFGKESALHYAVLSLVATGAHTWGEIRSRAGQSEGALLPTLQWLQEMELIEREVPVTKSASRSKVSLYRVADPYLRFWYRFIEPLYTAGAVGTARPELLWSQRIAPFLDDHMGGVFEDICRKFVRGGRPLPFEPFRIGRWWTRDSAHEVDLVVRGVEDELFVAECKWGSVGRAELELLRQRSQRVAADIGGEPQIHLGLFSGSGKMDRTVAAAVEAGEVAFFGPEAVFGSG